MSEGLKMHKVVMAGLAPVFAFCIAVSGLFGIADAQVPGLNSVPLQIAGGSAGAPTAIFSFNTSKTGTSSARANQTQVMRFIPISTATGNPRVFSTPASGGSTKMTVTLQGVPSVSWTFRDMFVGIGNTQGGACSNGVLSGCAYNFDPSATITRVTCGGLSTCSVPPGGLQMDTIPFVVDYTKPLTFTWNTAGGGVMPFRAITTGATSNTSPQAHAASDYNGYSKAFATVTAKIDNGAGGSGNILNVTAVTCCTVTNVIGTDFVVAGSVTVGTQVSPWGTGGTTGVGGTGTYQVSPSQLVTPAITMSIAEAGTQNKSATVGGVGGYGVNTAGNVWGIYSIVVQ